MRHKLDSRYSTFLGELLGRAAIRYQGSALRVLVLAGVVRRRRGSAADVKLLIGGRATKKTGGSWNGG